MTSFSHDSPRLAETYDRVSDLQFESGKRLIQRLGLQQGARVLDVRSTLTFAHGCTTTELVSLVLESRLTLEELHLAQGARTYATGEAVVEFMEASSFGTFLRPVPEELRASLRSDLIAAFDARRESQGVVMRSWGILFVASRE